MALALGVAILGATALGVFLGRRVRHLSDTLKEPFGVLQAALLGVVGLILAFGLSLAVTRYENRRDAVVDEANTIGTTFLRAQTLPEPMRSRSLALLNQYTESAVSLTNYIPGSSREHAVEDTEEDLQRRLWALNGQALAIAPVASAPRLYEETLNEMIDAQATRVAGLNNRVPNAVLFLEVLGAALALGLLAAYLAIVGRGVVAVSLAALLVTMLVFVICDLDRPTRGPIQVPDTALRNVLAEMQPPPAATAPPQSAES
jgi:Flp pilus assembly protein TadB